MIFLLECIGFIIIWSVGVRLKVLVLLLLFFLNLVALVTVAQFPLGNVLKIFISHLSDIFQ